MKFSHSKLTGFFTATLAATAILTSTLRCTAAGGGSAAGPTAGNNKKEGTVDGGGGKGVLCKLPNGRSRLITLDRFEAEAQFGNDVQMDSSTIDEALLSIAERFTNHSNETPVVPKSQWSEKGRADILREWSDLIGSRLKPVARGTRLSLTQDASLPSLPSNCQVVQIAVYDKTGVIHYDTEYWSMLDPMDIAVLHAHEYYYLQYRKYGYKTSDETRALISRILANRLAPMFEDLWNKSENLYCYGGGAGNTKGELYEFYLAPSQNRQDLNVYFKGVGKEFVYSRTVGTIPNMNFDEFMSERFKHSRFEVHEPLFGKKWIAEIAPNTQVSSSAANAKQILFRASRDGEPETIQAWVSCHRGTQRPPEQW